MFLLQFVNANHGDCVYERILRLMVALATNKRNDV